MTQLAALTEQRAEVDGLFGDLQVRVDDLTRAQRRAEQDVEQVKARRERDQQRLDGGQVGSPKDLERLQAELGSLQRRIGELEDTELEVMEELETAQQQLAGHRKRRDELDDAVAETTRARDERLAVLREEAGEVVARRKSATADLPADLLGLYDRLRQQKGGVGAAALRARRCGGCSLELNSSDLAEIARRPVDEVVRCEECGRILVRTAESGL